MTRWFCRRWLWAAVLGTTAAFGVTLARQGGGGAPPGPPKVGDVITLKFRDGPDRQVKVLKSERQPDGSYLSEVKDTKTGEVFPLVDRSGDAPETPPDTPPPAGKTAPKPADPPKKPADERKPLFGGSSKPPAAAAAATPMGDSPKTEKPEEERPGLLKRIFGRKKPTPPAGGKDGGGADKTGGTGAATPAFNPPAFNPPAFAPAMPPPVRPTPRDTGTAPPPPFVPGGAAKTPTFTPPAATPPFIPPGTSTEPPRVPPVRPVAPPTPVIPTPVAPPTAAPPSAVPPLPIPSVPAAPPGAPATPALPGIPSPLPAIPSVPMPPAGTGFLPPPAGGVTRASAAAPGPVVISLVIPAGYSPEAAAAMVDDLRPHLTALRTELAPSKRALAARAMAGGRHGSTDGVKLQLFQAARTDLCPMVRAVCIEELCKLGYYDPAFQAFLRESCNSSAAEVRDAARTAAAAMAPRK